MGGVSPARLDELRRRRAEDIAPAFGALQGRADALYVAARPVRAREEQADKLFREIIEIADDASGDYVTTSDGKTIVDHENIQRSRLRVDTRKWAAARLAPKKYGDHISHDVKGPGANFQPAILITVDGQPHDEFARQLTYDEGGGVLLDGNGDIVRAR